MPTEDVRIGDFTKPVVPPKPAPAPTATGATKDALDAAEQNIAVEAKNVEEDLKPKASYEEKLRQLGITKEEAARIIDAVLVQGFYSEEIALTKSLRVRFRTRSARDTRRAQLFIERERPMYDQHYNELLWRQLLSASLEQIGSDKFEFPTRKDTPDQADKLFEIRFNYVDSMPDPTFRLLLKKLGVFDTKISTVLEEGAVENF